jgi:chorismate mutase
VHWNTEKTPGEIVHIYIKGAVKLRPDRTDLPPVDWTALESWINDNLDQNVKSARG